MSWDLFMQNLSDLTAAMLAAASRAGADAADAIATDARALSIDVRGGALEHAERTEGIEIGLRVLVGQRQACVAASDVSERTIAEIAERAVAMAGIAPEDPHVGLADADDLAKDWDLAVLDLADPADDPAPADLQSAAAEAEAIALGVEGISKTDTTSASFSRSRIHLAASNGFSGGYERTSHGLYCVAITGQGTEMERDYAGEGRIYRSDLPTPEEIGRLAAERTLARAGARRRGFLLALALDDAPRAGEGELGRLEQLVVGVEDVLLAEALPQARAGHDALQLVLDAADHQGDAALAEQVGEVLEHRHGGAADGTQPLHA